MIVMGIDASTTSTGIAIFEDKHLVYHTTIKGEGDDWRERLFSQSKPIVEIIDNYHPNQVFMEDVPLKRAGGMKTLVILGGVQGFIYGIMASHQIPIIFLNPTIWRSDIGIFDGTKEGKTRDKLKEKAVKMANELFDTNLIWNGPNSKKSQDDEAESILIAYSQIKPKKFGK